MNKINRFAEFGNLIGYFTTVITYHKTIDNTS